MFFFFQAEDGIRDLIVTGVQTCALPIFQAMDSLFPMQFAGPLSNPPETSPPSSLGSILSPASPHSTLPRVSRTPRSEEHTSELQSRSDLVCRLLLEKKKTHTTHGLLQRL